MVKRIYSSNADPVTNDPIVYCVWINEEHRWAVQLENNCFIS
jgi:hypothetical protein